MVNELECEKMALKAVQSFVNSCDCQTTKDASLVLQKLIAVAAMGLDRLERGRSEIVQ